MRPTTSPVFGCILASWTDGKYVHPDITLQGDNGGGFATISPDQYEVHSARGAVVRKPYNSSGTAVDWSSYTSGFRASYWVYDPATNVATRITTEAQTVAEQDFGIAPFDPATGQLNESTGAANRFLVGNYLSLGAYGTRPADSSHGTGLWGDETGIYGLYGDVRQFYWQVSTGKGYAGGGVLVLDEDGISIAAGNGDVNYVKWLDGANIIFAQYAVVTGGVTEAVVGAKGKNSSNRESILELYATTDDNAAHAGTGIVSVVLDTELDGGSVYVNAPTIGLVGAVSASSLSVGTGFTSAGIDDNADAVAVTIDSSERLIIGNTSGFNVATGFNTRVQIYSTGTTAANAGITIGRFTNDTDGARLVLLKSRATSPGSFAVPSLNDVIGEIIFDADDGGDYTNRAAAIIAKLDAAGGSGDTPGRLEFYTTADGSASPTLRLTISSAGLATFANAVTVTGAATLSSTLDVTGKTTIGTGTGTGVNPDNFHVDVNATGAGDHLAAASLINFTGTTSADSVQALEGYVELNHTAGTVTRALGSIGHVFQRSTGLLTDSKVFVGSHISENGSGAITNVYIFKSDGIVRIGTPGTITNGYGLYLDALPSSGVTNRYGVYQAGSGDVNVFSGRMFIGDTADTNVTLGLTINQGTNDDFILTLKSADVQQLVTGVAEEDTFGSFGKVNTQAGGLEISGYKDTGGGGTPGNAVRLRGYLSEAANTTHNASGAAIVDISASVTDGSTGAQAPATNGNLVSFSKHNTIVFLFDADGDAFADGSTFTIFDGHDDIALLNMFNDYMAAATGAAAMDLQATQATEQHLKSLKLLHPDVKGAPFINNTKVQQLSIGAVRQIAKALESLSERTERRLSRLEAKAG